MNKKWVALLQRIRTSPSQSILLGFGFMILVGALLLNLPFASKSGESIGFVNALFTAASANCVTGLVVATTAEQWTFFGQVVILLLIQFGGLGFMTMLTLFMMLVRQKVSLKNRLAIQASFNLANIGGLVRLVKKISVITLSVEGVGAVFLAVFLGTTLELSFIEAVWYGIFHSISAFCNAGFDIVGNASFMPFVTNVPINMIVVTLIISGGLGFTVWAETIRLIKTFRQRPLRQHIAHISLHTKIVLVVTVMLLLGGTVLFLIFEWNNPQTLGDLTPFQKVQAAFFQSVTLRTAGFNTIDQAGLKEISQFLSSILMLIGGSPASTAGGAKTVTVGIIFIAMLSVLRGRDQAEAFGRTITFDLIQKALTVVLAMLGVVFLATTLLHFTEQNSPFEHSFLDLLFETCSATGTVGITTGITPHLSSAGKLIITVCMYLGRLGPVTVVVALTERLGRNAGKTSLPDEGLIIG